MGRAKPFVKWVGGKGRLISQLEALLPAGFGSWRGVTYVEPFIGGGAMLFHMLQTYGNIVRAVINDINPDLATCYRVVRDSPCELIAALGWIGGEYHSIGSDEGKKDYYLAKREEYNSKSLGEVENSALFIFLNRTCFNGLYRVNKRGLFNVPFGRYKSPLICDEETIIADSRLLQNVEILVGDFENTLGFASPNSLYYIDPPYRPITPTASFTDYSKEDFADADQLRLKEFCDMVGARGGAFMLSNSDSANAGDTFFDDLYSEYAVERVVAKRCVNCNGSGRGAVTEILVRNRGVESESAAATYPALCFAT